MRKPTRKALKVLERGDFHLAILPLVRPLSSWEFNDPAAFVHSVVGTVVLCDDCDGPLVEVGTFVLHTVDAEGARAQGAGVYDTFDHSRETWSFFEILMARRGSWDYKASVLRALGCWGEVVSLTVVVLSRLEIYPEYRGQDYGLAAIQCMLQRYRVGAGMFVLKAFPLQFEDVGTPKAEDRGLDRYFGDESVCAKRLRDHYARLGFIRIPKTDVMGLATLDPLKDLPLKLEWAPRIP